MALICISNVIHKVSSQTYQKLWGAIFCIFWRLLLSDFTVERMALESVKTQLHKQRINNDVNGGVCSQSPKVPDVEPAVGSTGGQDGLVVGRPLDL